MTQQVEAASVADEAGAFRDPDSNTARLYERAARSMIGGTSRIHYHFAPYPIFAASGAGAVVTDVEGVERLDFLNNMTALIHGHAHPDITRALAEQIRLGTAFSEPVEAEIRLAELLIDRVDSVEKIRFANSGTEAIMLAVKLARAFTGRSAVAKFEGFYHGYYDYMQVSYQSRPDTWGDPGSPASVASSGGLSDTVKDEIVTLPFNDPDAVETLLGRRAHDLAALILDPLCNRCGFALPAPGFYDFLREITRDLGIVLIYDEVLSFRLGYNGAQARFGGTPDLTAFGKIIGGGLPVGAVGGRDDIMQLLDPSHGAPVVASGGTASGNPLTMAAGIAALELLTPDAVHRLDLLGERLRAGAAEVFESAGVAAQLSGRGSLFRLVPTDRPIVNYRSLPTDADSARLVQRLHLGLLDNRVIVSKDGLGCLSTPMDETHIDRFVTALEASVAALGS